MNTSKGRFGRGTPVAPEPARYVRHSGTPNSRTILPLAMIAASLGFWNLQQLRAEVIDDRPYPLLEFFLAHDCITRDVEVTTLIEALARSDKRLPADLLQAYQTVVHARRACAAGSVARSLVQYDTVVAALCPAHEQFLGIAPQDSDGPPLRRLLCNDPTAPLSR